MYNYDDFGTNLWQNLGDFVCNLEVCEPVEILQEASHQNPSNCFHYVEQSCTQSTACSITKDLKMAVDTWPSTCFQVVWMALLQSIQETEAFACPPPSLTLPGLLRWERWLADSCSKY